MTSTTDRIGLVLIEAGQSQKEWFHNEALATVDVALQASVRMAGLDLPPAAPESGQCWIVGSAPSGAWTGHEGALAGWTSAGWRFVAAREGLEAWDEQRQMVQRFSGGAWRAGVLRAAELRVAGERVVGARGGAIADPVGGAAVDEEARAAIGAILAALREHGLISR